MSKKDSRDILFSCLFGSISFASFLTTILVASMKYKLSSTVVASCILILQKIIKIGADTVFSVYADLHGSKKMFLVAPFITCLCSALILIDSIYAIITAMILHAFAYGMKMNKVESRIYNILSANGKQQIFPRVIGAYFFLGDVLIGAASYLAAIIYGKHGAKGILVAVCIQSLVAFLCAMFIEDSTVGVKERKTNALNLLKDAVGFTRKFPIVISISLLLAFYDFFGWQLIPILKMSMVQSGLPMQDIMKVGAAFSWCTALGCFCSFVVGGRISFRVSFVVWFLEGIVMLCLTIHSQKYISILGIKMSLPCLGVLMYTFFYAIVEIVAMRSLESLIPSNTRHLLVSFNNMVSLSVSIFGNLFVGYFARMKYGYSFALHLWVVIVLCISCFIYLCIRRFMKQGRN